MYVYDNISHNSACNEKYFGQDWHRKSKHIYFLSYVPDFFLRKSWRLLDNVEKNGTAGQTTDDNMAHGHCMPDN